MEDLYRIYKDYPQVFTDTRNLVNNGIYFALKGPSFDGNKFALEAIQNGAAWAVVDDESLKHEKNCFYVQDVLTTLQTLANYHRKHLSIPFIGITGSNGKTTTKELIAQVLSKKFNLSYTQGNLNNHIGVPLSLLRVTEEHELAIIEMGANHVGEIAFLSSIAEPNFGIITNIGEAHLEGFGGIQGVIKGKSELYDFLRLNHGKAIVNGRDDLLMKQSKGMERSTYGTEEGDYPYQDLKGAYQAAIKVEGIEIHSNLIGKYNNTNLGAAMAFGLEFGVALESIKEALEQYNPGNHRSQFLETEKNRIILDAYNANPSSMRNAIEEFAGSESENPLMILGDMFELGEKSKEKHQEIYDLAKSFGIKTFWVGSNFFGLEGDGCFFKDRIELENEIKENPIQNQTLLIKGSRGMALEKLLDLL